MRFNVPTDTSAIFVAGVLGAILGSFLNVLIVRLPKEESIVFPGSKCPKCGNPVAWFDNLPMLSWVFLAGKCRRCRETISVQYPLVELITALLWAAAVWRYGVTLEAVTGAVFGTMLLGIGVTDAKHYLIPDEYTVGGLVVGLLLSVRNGFDGLLGALLGAAAGFALLYVVAVLGEKVFRKEAMGGGDIKMMAMVGAFVGWKGVLLTIFGGSLLGTLIFVPITLILKQQKLVPFGVFLAAAAGLTFVFGDTVVQWYVRYLTGA